jgi:hypothetical protein
MSALLTCVTAGGAGTSADLLSYLTPDLRDAARTQTNRWIKSLRLVAFDGQSMRERFTYRGDSLWWFTELYLQKMRRLDTAVAGLLALEAAVATHAPARLVVTGADVVMAEVAAAFGRRHGLAVEVHLETPAARRGWPGYLVGLTARLSRMRPAGRMAVSSPLVAAFVHTAFWSVTGDVEDPQQERYIGPVLDAVARRIPREDMSFVGVGPRRNFRARRWWDPVTPATGARPPIVPIERFAPRRALDGALDIWRRRRALAHDLTTGDGIQAAGLVRECDLWPVLRRELEGAAQVQWPWSVRAMDEAGAALDELHPKVVLTYAEAGGWGRALVLEARRRDIPSVGLQHGFIYRHWLNYLHEPDEFAAAGADRGCPVPTRTLVYDRYAEHHLTTAGHYPPGSLAVTGNARLDDLSRGVAAVDADSRLDIRTRLGVRPQQTLAVLAAKFTEIRDHLPGLVAAVDGLPRVHLAIKPHPAETPSVYAALSAGRSNVSIAPADLDLARLVASADGLVTMNSTVAIDGLALGVPSLVIGLPNNLSPFVTAGVMLGAEEAGRIQSGLEALLYDSDVRQGLARAAAGFLDRYDMRPKGDAAARASEEILALAGSSNFEVRTSNFRQGSL